MWKSLGFINLRTKFCFLVITVLIKQTGSVLDYSSMSFPKSLSRVGFCLQDKIKRHLMSGLKGPNDPNLQLGSL